MLSLDLSRLRKLIGGNWGAQAEVRGSGHGGTFGGVGWWMMIFG